MNEEKIKNAHKYINQIEEVVWSYHSFSVFKLWKKINNYLEEEQEEQYFTNPTANHIFDNFEKTTIIEKQPFNHKTFKRVINKYLSSKYLVEIFDEQWNKIISRSFCHKHLEDNFLYGFSSDEEKWFIDEDFTPCDFLKHFSLWDLKNKKLSKFFDYLVKNFPKVIEVSLEPIKMFQLPIYQSRKHFGLYIASNLLILWLKKEARRFYEKWVYEVQKSDEVKTIIFTPEIWHKIKNFDINKMLETFEKISKIQSIYHLFYQWTKYLKRNFNLFWKLDYFAKNNNHWYFWDECFKKFLEKKLESGMKTLRYAESFITIPIIDNFSFTTYNVLEECRKIGFNINDDFYATNAHKFVDIYKMISPQRWKFRKELYEKILNVIKFSRKKLWNHDIFFPFNYSSFNHINFKLLNKVLSQIVEPINSLDLNILINILDDNFNIEEFRDCKTIEDFKKRNYSCWIENISLNKKELKRNLKFEKHLQEKMISYNKIFSTLFDSNKEEIFNRVKKKDKFLQNNKVLFSDYLVFTNEKNYTLEEYLKELLGKKDCFGSAKKPWKLFFELKQNNVDINNVKKEQFFIVKNLIEKFSQKEVKIERYSIKIEPTNSIWYYCAGDFSNCCMWFSSQKLKQYIKQRGFTILNVYLWNKIIGNSLLWSWFLNWKKTLFVDNVELIQSERKNSTILISIYENFLKIIKEEWWFYQIVQWEKFNDLELPSEKIIDVENVKPIGFEISQSFSERENETLKKMKIFDKLRAYFYFDTYKNWKLLSL